jgi:hypothetical protein
MRYSCETTSVEGFVQLLACNLLPHGYWFYVTGHIPDGKDLRRVDAKLIDKYDAGLSRAARARRKQLGIANVRYLRHERFFVLLATHGRHCFFEEEASSIRDIRHVPLKFAGYSISYRRGGRKRNGKPDASWHSHVRISRPTYRELEAHLLEMSVRRSVDCLAREFYRLPFEPYAPVRRQMLKLLAKVNCRRKQACLRPIPYQVVPLHRRAVKTLE